MTWTAKRRHTFPTIIHALTCDLSSAREFAVQDEPIWLSLLDEIFLHKGQQIDEMNSSQKYSIELGLLCSDDVNGAMLQCSASLTSATLCGEAGQIHMGDCFTPCIGITGHFYVYIAIITIKNL
jgi:hypothetical protein